MMKNGAAGSVRTSSPNITGYTILHEVGRGGIATVYLAIQKSLQRQVALKVMAPALSMDPTFTDRFIHEGRTIAQLNHPGIVTIYDISVVNFHHYIAMEYLQGGSLKQRLQRALPVSEALDIVAQMASALELAHHKGVVHRDVKPENIMFRGEDNQEAVLTDFGIAKSNATQTQLTSDGMVVGTPRYMSPERAEGKEAGPRSDIYALGIILYEMLAGKPPFGAKENLAVLYSHINDPIPKLPGEFQFLQSLLEEMLAKDPAARISDCTTLLDRLREYGHGHGSASVSGVHQSAMNPQDRQSGWIERLRDGFVAMGRLALWGGTAVVSIVVISTVIWGVMRFSTQRVEVDTSLPEGEPPEIVTPAKIDLTQPDGTPAAEPEPTIDVPVDVNALLGLAENQIKKNYLSTPEGNNARDTLRAILKIDPGNAEATKGLKRIADRYQVFAKRHMSNGNPDRALASVRAGLAVWPEHSGLHDMLARAEAEVARSHEPAINGGEIQNETIRESVASAKNGNTKSQFDLAIAYGNGAGVDKNYDESMKWLREAANGDHVAAQYNLALGLLFGPRPSAREAGRWIKTLAENHYEPAYRVLGWMYTTGIGVKRNSREAVRWSAKNWGLPRIPAEVVDTWQASFEEEYHAAIGKIREEKITRSERLK